ncbi:hypothetical protein G9A89_016359 [Geosiphon pyriformis]|nr:hypothetical protein G9A89_016359 [Geosiphon pyriformis]
MAALRPSTGPAAGGPSNPHSRNNPPHRNNPVVSADPDHSTEENPADLIEIILGPNKDMRNITFIMKDEDHTLGNALRYIIMKNPEVEYCGYSIPHPSEAKLNIRIQTKKTTDAVEALKKGLNDLTNVCDHVYAQFVDEIAGGRYEYDPEAKWP